MGDARCCSIPGRIMSELSYPEFLAFLMLYAASADLKIDEKEVPFIKNEVGVDNYEQIRKLFDSQNDYQRVQTIMAHELEYFPDEEQVELILEDMERVFMEDEDYSLLEHNQLMAIRRVLS